MSTDAWWEKNPVITRINPREKSFKKITTMLDEVKSWGSGAIEIFAPYRGFGEYSGLDVLDYYSVDPDFGTKEDFLELVKAAHEKNMAIIAFMNMGYCLIHHPAFLKACLDKGQGIESTETHYFVWSDTDKKVVDRSLAPYFMNDAEDGHWQYSDVSKSYYWVKWRGTGNNVDLPQFNFGDPIWQDECSRVIKFRMETGIDGMIIDAVNWYTNCNWEINPRTMTDVVLSYGNKFLQPEVAGGFNDDPVPWIQKGGYNCVQDYGMAIWWNNHDEIRKALKIGDPSGIEKSLASYRDKVVAAGGVTYLGPDWGKPLTNQERTLEVATLATVGEMFHQEALMLDLDWPDDNKNELKRILCMLGENPAFNPGSSRIKLDTNDAHKYYAFIRESADKKQKILVVLNFQDSMQQIQVSAKGRHTLVDVFTNVQSEFSESIGLTLQPYGYKFFYWEPIAE